MMWNKIRWYLQKFMIGRNGRDELQVAVVYAGLILYAFASCFSMFFPFKIVVVFVRILKTAGWLALIYGLYRFCSKDVYRRREENRKFLQEVEFFKLRHSMRKTHKIYRCKSCGRKIRVPKGKGKIEITCPLCGQKFIKRT